MYRWRINGSGLLGKRTEALQHCNSAGNISLEDRRCMPSLVVCCVTAGKYQLEKPMKGTTEVLYSVANSVDTNFTLPTGYNKFPFDAPPSSHKAGLTPDQVKVR